MTPTVEYVQTKISEFNALVFSSELPPIPVKLTNARTFLGKVQYRKKRGWFGINEGNTDFVMRISTKFDLTEREQDDVILHEMIHYYIAWKGLKDSSTHGRIFREYMERINRDFGRNITVSHKMNQGAVSPRGSEVRQHIICVSQFQDGNTGITVCARTRVSYLYRNLPKYYHLKWMSWYFSMDPFFNRFPRSNTPKIYKISPEDLSEHLKNAQPLELGALNNIL